MEAYRTCPICVEVPAHEIYQCVNGHVICSDCITKVGSKCPACRVPFADPKTRNRALETILDEQEFPCPFEQKGCLAKRKRGDLPRHEMFCKLNPARLLLCEWMGFQNCNFEWEFASCLDIFEHLQTTHDNLIVPKLQTEGMCIKFELDPLIQYVSGKGQRPPSRFHLIRPEFEEKSSLFLIVEKPNSETQDLSYDCFQISGDSKLAKMFMVEFSVVKYIKMEQGNGRPPETREAVLHMIRQNIVTFNDVKKIMEPQRNQKTVPASIIGFITRTTGTEDKWGLSIKLIPASEICKPILARKS